MSHRVSPAMGTALSMITSEADCIAGKTAGANAIAKDRRATERGRSRQRIQSGLLLYFLPSSYMAQAYYFLGQD